MLGRFSGGGAFVVMSSSETAGLSGTRSAMENSDEANPVSARATCSIKLCTCAFRSRSSLSRLVYGSGVLGELILQIAKLRLQILLEAIHDGIARGHIAELRPQRNKLGH